ncbi:MAG: hybrid sensor histidine kinase/response regulator, partial [Blastocatellia bacterium]
SRGPEGILARQLALGGGVALLGLGLLTEWGEHAAHIQPQAEKALLITAGIATLTLLVWRAMGAIARLDVTRSEAEAALRQSEGRYRAVSELTSDYVYEIHVAMDGQMALEEVTAAFTRITGFTLEEWRQRGGLRGHLHPEDLPVAQHRLQRLIAGEVDVSEFRIITRDGEVRWLRDFGRPVWDEATGRVTRIYGAVEDITERKQAEEARRESEERLRLAAQAADFGAYDFNLITGKGYWSPELNVIFGLSEDSENVFSLSQIIEISHPDDRERLEQAIRASADPLGSGDLVDEPRILRPDGAVVWVMIKGKTFFAGQGTERRAARATGTVLDISERKRVEAERERLYEQEKIARAEAERMRAVAEAANRSKDEFLTMVSHELRSPLNAVLGYTRLLRSGPADSAFVAHAATIVERNAKAQLQIVEDLLDSARIITGKLRLETRPADLVPVLEAALGVVRPAAESKGVELVNHFSPLPEQVLGDTNRLQQIVWNLLSNAVKFTPEGGRVELRMESDAERVRITVSDNGAGIAPEFLPYVFDRFRQADTSVTRRFGGLGLGLSLVKQLTELHGGTIEAASEGVGRGATFTVTLPRLAMQPALFAQSQSTAMTSSEVQTENAIPLDEAPSLDGLLILIVDDQEEARELLTYALNECGARVMAVSSGVEALAILSDPPGGARPDALILDIAMPDEDGYAVLQKVRALEAEKGIAPSEQIPSIALTAYGRSEDRLRALAAGFRMHVAKPVEPVELAIVIASLTNRRHKKRDVSE